MSGLEGRCLPPPRRTMMPAALTLPLPNAALTDAAMRPLTGHLTGEALAALAQAVALSIANLNPVQDHAEVLRLVQDRIAAELRAQVQARVEIARFRRG